MATCREAILKTLEESGKPLRASEIAQAINACRSYARGDGQPLPPYQVYAVAYQNDDLFEIKDGRIGVGPRRRTGQASPLPQQKYNRIIVCSAGAHFVAGELSRQGWVVALVAKGVVSVDLLAKLHQSRALSIQVKSRTSASQYAWRLGAPPRPSECDFYVFVDLQDEGKRPQYFVVPTAEALRLWSCQQIRTEDVRKYADDWNQLYMEAERSSPNARRVIADPHERAVSAPVLDPQPGEEAPAAPQAAICCGTD